MITGNCGSGGEVETTLFHVFRNTPLGREILMQSLYFCGEINASIVIYIPEHTKFLMYFENDVVQVDLDESYRMAPDTAKAHALELVREADMEPRFIRPKNFTASTLPDLPVNFDFMCCPRSISDLSSKISLGHIGPKVRRIINAARFPVLMPSCLFKEWQSIYGLFWWLHECGEGAETGVEDQQGDRKANGSVYPGKRHPKRGV